MASNKEIEIKLRLNPDQAAALAELWPCEMIGVERSHFRTVYYDDAKRHLQHRGIELTLRQDGQRIRQILKVGVGIFRDEWEVDLEGDHPCLDRFGGAAKPIASFQPYLEPIFFIEVERMQWSLKRGGALITASIDRGQLLARDRRQMLCEAELEIKDGPVGALFDLAEDVAQKIEAPLSFISKGSRGDRLANGDECEPESVLHLQLDDADDANSAFERLCAACLRQFSFNEELLRKARGIETTHQARVALRRLRTAFSLFGSIVVGGDVDHVKAELKWISRRLGDVRDLDVLLTENLRELEPQSSSVSGFKALEGKIVALRAEAENALGEALASERFRNLLIATVRCIHCGDWRREQRSLPLSDLAEQELSRRLKTIRKGKKALLWHDSERTHRLRIQAKKLRYMIDFLEGTDLGRSFRKTGQRLAALQKHLGAAIDAAATSRLLEAIIQGESDETLSAAAQLIRNREESIAPIQLRRAARSLEKLL